jgi:hypothetical protein
MQISDVIASLIAVQILAEFLGRRLLVVSRDTDDDLERFCRLPLILLMKKDRFAFSSLSAR